MEFAIRFNLDTNALLSRPVLFVHLDPAAQSSPEGRRRRRRREVAEEQLLRKLIVFSFNLLHAQVASGLISSSLAVRGADGSDKETISHPLGL